MRVAPLAVLARLRGWSRDPRITAALALGCLALAGVLLAVALRTGPATLRISGGQSLGLRHTLAEQLAAGAGEHELVLEVVETEGSTEALAAVQAGELDAALVQGGLEAGPAVREAAALVVEPLHLLVRGEVDGVRTLKGRTVNVGAPGSGTQRLALDVLRFAGLVPGRDLTLVEHPNDALTHMDEGALPDAVFHVSALPAPFAEFLVRERGYRLAPLPFAEALALRQAGVREVELPAYAYGVTPAVPPEPLPTVGARMLLVVREGLPDRSVRRLTGAAYDERFVRQVGLPRDADALLAHPELPLHPGAAAWLARHEQVLTPEVIDNLESLRSFFVSLAVALFLGWRWWRARRLQGFETYIAEVTALERETLSLEQQAALDLERLWGLRRRLGAIKSRGLEAHAAGRMASDELLAGFLLHVSDVRMHLDALILHARERLEKKARRQGEVQEEDAILEALWAGAFHPPEEGD